MESKGTRHNLPTSDTFAEAFAEFSQTRLYQRLAKKFTPRPYYLKFQVLRLVALVASYLFNTFSALTAAVLVFFFTSELFGYYAPAAIITAGFVFLLEVTKRRTNSVLFRDYLQFRRFSSGLVALASFALILAGLSVVSSYFGGARTVEEFTPGAELVDLDTITAPIREQIATIDKQIEEARATKWKTTTTRTSQQTIKSLTDQKTALLSQLIAVENRTEQNNTATRSEHARETAIKARRFAGVTLLSEFLFLLCAFYIEFYDYRSLAEFSDTDQPETKGQAKRAANGKASANRSGRVNVLEWSSILPTTSNGNGAANGSQNGNDTGPNNQVKAYRRPIGFFSDRGNDTETNFSHTKIVCNETTSAETIPEAVAVEASPQVKETKQGAGDRRRICDHCGEPYTYNHKKQRFCSPGCRQAAWKEKNGRAPYMKRRK